MSRMKPGLWMSAFVVAAAMTQMANGQLIVGRGIDANEVFHVDVGTTAATPLFNLTANGITFGNGVEGLDVDDAGRTIYLITGGTTPTTEVLYRAHYDDRDFSDPSRIRVRKVADLTFAGTAPRLSGLAYNSTNGNLYASYEFSAAGVSEGIYEINTTTGALTLVMDLSSQASSIALSGLAHNPVDNLLYATNNTGTSPNIFLNSIDLTQPPATARTVIANAAITTTDEGLAIANNKAYILNSNAGPAIKVFDLVAGAFDAPITSAGWTGTDNAAGAGWGPNALTVPAGSNLATTISATPTNTLEYPVGTQINYTVQLTNFGPSAATNVNYSIVLSGAAAAISGLSGGNAVEGPAGTITGSEATWNVGQVVTVTFTATTSGTGTLTATASIPPGANTDAYLGNNTEALAHVIRVYPAIDLEFTSVQTSPKSAVPGGLMVENTTSSGTERFRKPSGSPGGNYVALQIDTNNPTTSDAVYVRRDPGNTWSTVVQEGVTAVDGGFIVGTPGTSTRLALLDDGRFGYSIDTNAPTASDEMTLLFDLTNHTVVAREGTIIPVFTALGIGYGASQDGTQMTGDARFAIRMSSMTGAGSSPNNTGIVSDSGNVLITRGGSSIPGNQLGGGTLAVSTLSTDEFYMDCTGSTHIFTGSLAGSVDVVVVDGNVVFQEGGPVSGFSGTLATGTWGTTAGIVSTQMYSNGEWWARGTTTVSSEDFVVKGFGGTYTTVAKNGDPIFTGSGENWSDVDGFSTAFMGYAANRQGSYVLTGRTNNANLSKNAVAVANGTTELFREGDRIDLDNNGLLDDDAFIDTFVIDMQLLTDAQDYYAVVNLRNGAGSFIGKALVHMANVGAPAATGADLSITKTVSDDALEALGEQTIFTVQVCNKGPADATNVVMNDALPAGLDFVSATNGAAETAPNSNIVTASVASMPACTCQTYDITVQAVAVGVHNNTATATSATSDPNGANNSDSASVTVTAISDLSVTKVDDGGAPVGGNFTYTITITNNGPAPATNVQMTDNLDPTTTFVSATNGAIQSSPGVVTRTFASIPNGGSQVVQITVTGNSQAIVTNQVSVTGNETDPDTNNNTAFVETIVGDVADLSVTLSNPGLQLVGQDFAYTLTVFNGGPTTATNVQVAAALPAGLNFVSATNGAVENPGGSGNIERTFASIASQASEVIVITVNSPTAGFYTVVASASGDQVDSDDLNNNAQIITRVGSFKQIRAIYTRISGDPTAVVPGLLDAADQPVFGEFDSMLNINVSSDGNRWTLDGGSDLAATSIDGVMMLGSGFTGTVFAQEGKQAAGALPGTLYTFFDDEVGFNSINDFSWGALTSVTADSDLTYTNIGGTNAIVAQTGSTVNGLQAGSGTINNSSVSQHLLNDGRVGFNASNISGSRAALVYWDSINGINSFMERNVTSIDGDLITGLPVDRIFYTTPDGMHTLVRASIAGGSMVVFDGSRVIKTGDALPGGFGNVDAVFDIHLGDNGDWIARGDKPGDDDWAVRNGVVVASTGQSIEGGAETWGNSIGTVRVNAEGDYLVVGNTSEPDTSLDGVIAVNGDVIAREGDPVDLDGNGLFDDDVFITSFSVGNVWLSNDLRVHFLATLRNGEGTNLNTAFLVVDLGGCQTILGDANGAGGRNGADVQAFVNCLLAGTPTGHPCKCADMDGDGDIDPADVTLFATTLVMDP